MFGFGGSELAIIAIIVLLIFGARRLPEIGKGLGGAIRELKNIKNETAKSGAPETKSDTRTAEGQSKDTLSLESRMAKKAIEQVPGLKKAVQIKEKADQLKSIIQ
ncbi:MAG: twin-arginine translocase TatA/TatE family subunit [Desulfobacteraceae bacterium]|jgi:sec-independent protein translocase protein TatA|nr:MAG: twin-arginine translocase TatA/TatE family subunit [Desulfobacteraceae bacterium]